MNGNKTLPNNKFLRGLVKFSRSYVSRCSKETISSMALLGMTQKDYVRLTKQLNAADTNLQNNTS